MKNYPNCDNGYGVQYSSWLKQCPKINRGEQVAQRCPVGVAPNPFVEEGDPKGHELLLAGEVQGEYLMKKYF